jgi:hypothetical protein
MQIRTQRSRSFSDLISYRDSTPELSNSSAPILRERSSLFRRFDPAEFDPASAAEVNGKATAAAQTDADRSESPQAARELIRDCLAGLLVLSAACLCAWCLVHLIQSLLEAELFVLRSSLPIHP